MKLVTAFLQLIRVSNILIITLGLSFFYILILVPAHRNKLFTNLLPFTGSEVVLFLLSVALIGAGGAIIHDYFNFESDKEFNPEKPLAQGVFSLNTAMYMHAAFAFAGIGLGFYLGYTLNNYKIGYLYIICVLLFYLYSTYLRKMPLVGNVLISALMSFPFILLMLFEVSFLKTISFEGANYVLDILLWQVKFYGGFIFLTTLAREIVKDIANKEADAEFNVNTIAVQFGETVGKVVASISLVLLLAGLSFFINGFIRANAIREFLYLGIAVVIPLIVAIGLIYSAKQKEHYQRIALLADVITLLGILSIPGILY